MDKLITWFVSALLVLFAAGMIVENLRVGSYTVMPTVRGTKAASGGIRMDTDRIIQPQLNSYAFTDSSKPGKSKSTRASGIKTNSLSYVQTIKKKISLMATKLYKAKVHVRGTKTSDGLREAIKLMEDILKILEIPNGPLKTRRTVKPTSVCPEFFKGSRYGYFPVNCTYKKPLPSLVTILTYFKKSNFSEITTFMNCVYSLNNEYKIIVALKDKKILLKLKKTFPDALFHIYTNKYVGVALNIIVAEFVTTPYVLVARNVELFTEDTRIERLVREIESLQVSVVGGAHRTPNGHWRKGCYQLVYRNYTVKYIQGYDESMHECIFCDYLTGPFITSKQTLEQHKFSQISDDQGLFEDWFLQLSQDTKESVVCPDSMFHIKYDTESDTKWDAFIRKWDLYKLVTPKGQTFYRSCRRLPRWFLPRSRSLHPCYVKSCANDIKFIARKCEANNISYEIKCGTLVGAVKMEIVLPWELDIDIPISSSAMEDSENFIKIFRQEGHRVILRSKPTRNEKNITTGGIAKVFGRHYKVDIWAQPILESDRTIMAGFKPTQVLVDGTWVNTAGNPGMTARNRYRDIYRHAVHYIATRRRSTSEYKTSNYIRCRRPNRHNCLDRYNTDGNIQFTDVFP